ncbi:hypothetical protein BTM25_19610 [Actinomadura rubteroloni]|uniref:Uncharacterized protein n=1 Tax=Actinomadura rubteroloni TaxID=1926885 RepID=A0A2P4UR73_9ACTN|nr:hypothetical protein [Actinomadura rubteroloni]POM27545.1 hypothetical protein BTM25_19610 [Actinomadura rubteroloni]
MRTLAVHVHAIPLNDDTVSPGLLGFGVFLLLGVALVFLVRSMNKRLKRIDAARNKALWEADEAPVDGPR